MFSNFFANWWRSTPRGRGLSYKIWAKSVWFMFFALNRYFAIAFSRSRKTLTTPI
jgi:hypothetical protein